MNLKSPFSLASLVSTSGLLATVAFAAAARADEPTTKFNRDIRAILSENCYACHGPDKNHREAELRLDTEEGAKAERDGHFAIVPGKPAESDLIARVTSKDDDERMPPVDSGKKLTPKQIELLRQWIAEGAQWEPHWSYMPLVAPKTPAASVPGGNVIDGLLSAHLAELKLAMAPEADRRTLIRRISFDLTGLPPRPEDVDAFLADKSDDAYSRLVDRLLASPHFGERMAEYWLDLVRYADTVGYHGDQEQHISPYRDYVIEAFNRNLPFDQFTREQLAGDLLKDSTLAQRIASGYNRLLQTSHEGGVQAKEYMAIYSADHVRNFSNVWLGGTMGCAQCHDHKFDPYSTKDFYAMAAFFADVDENRHLGHGQDISPTPREPVLAMPTDEQREKIAKLEAQLADLKAKQKKERAKAESQASAAPAELAPSNTGGVTIKETKPTKKRKRPRSAKTPTPPAATTPTPHDNEITTLEAELKSVNAGVRRTMITVAMKPRVIRVLPRGNWQDDSGDIVEPAVPEFLGKIETAADRATRLDLANWLVDREHGVAGLTSRVMVNRLWYLMFGRGLSGSLDDLGTQGDQPVHPELIEYLAGEFVSSGWDMKHMLKLMAMSRAYRQTSADTPKSRERDPLNQFFARQSRYRLPAEMVRDSALSISGLLVDEVGGPSVRPYQPAGYYRHLNFPEREYQSDVDNGQWRRGVYMHWQRQYLHPMLKAFDAPSREECTALRSRSNTPVAALVLLNDPTFVEAARMFAVRILRSSTADAAARLDLAFREALSRPADDVERQLLVDLLGESQKYYSEHPEAADQLLSVGLKKAPDDMNRAELAAWTVVARSILSRHETLTRN